MASTSTLNPTAVNSPRLGDAAAEPQSVAGQSAPATPPGLHAFLTPDLTENYPSIHGLTGRSPAVRQLVLQMQRMAPHLTLASLEGEEGTGRSLAARALHLAGPAAAEPFVPCLATHFFSPEPATEKSEGHGLWSADILRQAHGGVLFLDRVHQLSAAQQGILAEFLHWFDDRHFHLRQEAVGDERRAAAQVPLPAQILFSSSLPLRHPDSHFREDLASRLCAVRFRLPPLTERREDIPLLAHIFIQRFARAYGKPIRGLGPGAIAPLLRHNWPGNVRELDETITAAALATESQWIRPIDLPPFAVNRRGRPEVSKGNLPETADCDLNLDEAIRSHVARVLDRTRGNKLRAAQLLGISRSTLYRILAPNSADEATSLDPSP